MMNFSRTNKINRIWGVIKRLDTKRLNTKRLDTKNQSCVSLQWMRLETSTDNYLSDTHFLFETLSEQSDKVGKIENISFEPTSSTYGIGGEKS